MTPKIILGRILVRFLLAMTLGVGLIAIGISFIMYSSQLGVITGEAWTIFGLLVGGLGTSLAFLSKAIAQNPSDRTKVTEEE